MSLTQYVITENHFKTSTTQKPLNDVDIKTLSILKQIVSRTNNMVIGGSYGLQLLEKYVFETFNDWKCRDYDIFCYGPHNTFEQDVMMAIQCFELVRSEKWENDIVVNSIFGTKVNQKKIIIDCQIKVNTKIYPIQFINVSMDLETSSDIVNVKLKAFHSMQSFPCTSLIAECGLFVLSIPTALIELIKNKQIPSNYITPHTQKYIDYPRGFKQTDQITFDNEIDFTNTICFNCHSIEPEQKYNVYDGEYWIAKLCPVSYNPYTVLLVSKQHIEYKQYTKCDDYIKRSTEMAQIIQYLEECMTIIQPQFEYFKVVTSGGKMKNSTHRITHLIPVFDGQISVNGKKYIDDSYAPLNLGLPKTRFNEWELFMCRNYMVNTMEKELNIKTNVIVSFSGNFDVLTTNLCTTVRQDCPPQDQIEKMLPYSSKTRINRLVEAIRKDIESQQSGTPRIILIEELRPYNVELFKELIESYQYKMYLFESYPNLVLDENDSDYEKKKRFSFMYAICVPKWLNIIEGSEFSLELNPYEYSSGRRIASRIIFSYCDKLIALYITQFGLKLEEQSEGLHKLCKQMIKDSHANDFAEDHEVRRRCSKNVSGVLVCGDFNNFGRNGDALRNIWNEYGLICATNYDELKDQNGKICNCTFIGMLGPDAKFTVDYHTGNPPPHMERDLMDTVLHTSSIECIHIHVRMDEFPLSDNEGELMVPLTDHGRMFGTYRIKN